MTDYDFAEHPYVKHVLINNFITKWFGRQGILYAPSFYGKFKETLLSTSCCLRSATDASVALLIFRLCLCAHLSFICYLKLLAFPVRHISKPNLRKLPTSNLILNSTFYYYYVVKLSSCSPLLKDPYTDICFILYPYI